ncbi:hypothetical protein Tco_0669673 [Tanacetum coccineum]
MQSPEQAFVDYAYSRNNGVGDTDDCNLVVEAEKTIEKEPEVYKVMKEGESGDTGNDDKKNDLENKACKYETELGKEEEWMEYEQPFDLVDVWKSVRYDVSKDWIRRIGDFLEHEYAISSLMDTAYWSSE